MRWVVALVLLLVLVGNGVHTPMAADGPATGPYRIYMVLYRGETEAERGFLDYLHQQGLEISVQVRDLDYDTARLPAIREEIRTARPDLVYSFGTTVTLGLVGAAGAVDPAVHVTEQPVVFNIVADPVGAQLVSDLAGSGRNLTGASHAVPLETQYRTLRTALPWQRLGVIYHAGEVNARLAVDDLARRVERDGRELVRAPVFTEGGDLDLRLELAVRSLAEAGAEVIYLPSDSLVIANARQISRQAGWYGLPTFAATEQPVRSGGATMGLVSAYYSVGQLAGYKAEQILRLRHDPGSMPIDSIDRFTFIVNVSEALRLRMVPPVSLLRVADFICSKITPCP